MKEAERHEVVLTIRNDGQGIDLHTGPKLSEVSKRVLRALELGGTPACVIQPGAMLGLGSVEARELRGKRIESMKPEPHQDDEALVEVLAKVLIEVPVQSEGGARILWGEASNGTKDLGRREASAVLKYLRAQGLLRTTEDVDMAARCENLLRMRSEDKAEKLSLANELSVAQAQLRALTAKAEEANRELERVLREAPHWAEGGLITQADWEQTSQLAVSEKARANKAQADLATTEQAYQREQVARKRAEYELTELRQACTVQPRWAGGRPVTQAEWDRYVALAAEVPQLKVMLGEP